MTVGIKAYDDVELQLRERMPLSMRDIVAAHGSAAQQARDAFEAHLARNIDALRAASRPPAVTTAVPSAFGFIQETSPVASAFGFLQGDDEAAAASLLDTPVSLVDAPVPSGAENEGPRAMDIDLHLDFQEYRAALECGLCRWRVPADGIDIASVIEVSEAGARLVKSNEAVMGRASALIRTNWDMLVGKSAAAWQRAYAPVAAKCSRSPVGYACIDEYEADLKAARLAAALEMEGLEEDFNVYLALETQREALLVDRNRVIIASARREFELSFRELIQQHTASVLANQPVSGQGDATVAGSATASLAAEDVAGAHSHAELEQRVDGLAAKFDDFEQQAATKAVQMEEKLEGKMVAAVSRCDEIVSEESCALEANFDALKAQCDELRTISEQVQARCDGLRSTCDGLEHQISDLLQSQTALQARISRPTEEVLQTDLNGGVRDLDVALMPVLEQRLSDSKDEVMALVEMLEGRVQEQERCTEELKETMQRCLQAPPASVQPSNESGSQKEEVQALYSLLEEQERAREQERQRDKEEVNGLYELFEQRLQDLSGSLTKTLDSRLSTGVPAAEAANTAAPSSNAPSQTSDRGAAVGHGGVEMVEGAAKLREEFQEMFKAFKDTQRRELKVVLDKAKTLEEKVACAVADAAFGATAAVCARVTTANREAASDTSPHVKVTGNGVKTDEGGGAENDPQSQLEVTVKNLEALEKKIEKKFRDASLATAAEVMKIKAECLESSADELVAAESKIEGRVKLVHDALVARCDELAGQLEDGQVRTAAAMEQAMQAAQAAEVVRVLQQEAQENVRTQLTAFHASVGKNCQRMFVLLEQQMAPREALNEVERRLARAIEPLLHNETVTPLRDLIGRLAEVEREVQGHSYRIDQGRDGVQALFGMIAQLPELAPQVERKRGLFSSMKKSMKNTIEGASSTAAATTAAATRLVTPGGGGERPRLLPPASPAANAGFFAEGEGDES